MFSRKMFSVPFPKLLFTATLLMAAAMLLTPSTSAQAQGDSPNRGVSALLEEVVVVARKREEAAMDVPLSISAYNSDQLDVLKIRDLTDLAVAMPNVALDEIGTTKGIASFSIRGLGINSSIPSIDPTVGVFVDGVYLGMNSGIVFDTFDLSSIEVLRGPQGILFGRNVTGGAVLLNSKKPADEFEASVKAAVDAGDDGGPNTYLMGSVSGPLADSLNARLVVYRNDDSGWFENLATGDDFGELEQTMLRPSILWRPSEAVELYLKYEYTDISGDGPAAQSHTSGAGVDGTPMSFDRDSHDFSIDEEGYLESESDLFSAQLDVQVGDHGAITNILGWRDAESNSLSDIDAQPVNLFHAPADLQSEQISNELRYNGLHADGKLNLTTGVYYFKNELDYHERRNLLGLFTGSPLLTQDGGGEYEVETIGFFLAGDFDLNESWTLTAGIRYTEEEKNAQIASLIRNVNSPCNVIEGTCSYDFTDDEKWESWAPKLGAMFHVSDDTRIFGHWARGFRSGGYNLRNTSGDVVNNGPGPFDEEQVDNYELGFKTGFDKGRLTGALFYNEVTDMQREVNLPDPASGVVQIIKNTADAEITGMELEGVFGITESLLLLASVGWLDWEYAEVSFDLNGDGAVNAADQDLDLPRAAKWTYSLGLNLDLPLGTWGYLTLRGNYAHRDSSAFTDNNLGFIPEQDIVDAGADIYSNSGSWVLSVYGKNVTNEVKFGGDTLLPANLGPVPLGGTFSPLAKGRVWGVEAVYNF